MRKDSTVRHERKFTPSTPIQTDLIDLLEAVKPKRKSPMERFRDKLETQPNGCIVYTGTIDTGTIGYGRFFAEGKYHRAHKWWWEQKNGPVPEGMHVLHGDCHNPACVEHLLLGTAKKNSDMKIAAGRARIKLKPHEVVSIVGFHEKGRSIEHLSEQFSVSTFAIRSILKGATWSKLTGIEYKPTRKGPDWKAINAAKAELRKAA